MIAEIINNEWKVNPHNAWDRNYTKDALEVRDPSGDIVLQVRVIENRVQLQAILYTSDGNILGFVDGGFGKGLIVFDRKHKIKPIFKYPSELHLGKFVEKQ
jgi:hypothetical protein